jgi:hypothetical protein
MIDQSSLLVGETSATKAVRFARFISLRTLPRNGHRPIVIYQVVFFIAAAVNRYFVSSEPFRAWVA